MHQDDVNTVAATGGEGTACLYKERRNGGALITTFPRINRPRSLIFSLPILRDDLRTNPNHPEMIVFEFINKKRALCFFIPNTLYAIACFNASE